MLYKCLGMQQRTLCIYTAGQSVGHLPLTQGKDLQLGMLLHRFDQLQSLQVRFKALTADSIASLQYLSTVPAGYDGGQPSE